jgi:2-polyprenyl-6-methoxyphenol hydroxylase-like FAD-dependent oxidoreductase
MRLARLLGQDDDLSTAFLKFESERRPRAERIVAHARSRGNAKHAFSPAGAWFRDRFVQLAVAVSPHSQDWMYRYDPRAA